MMLNLAGYQTADRLYTGNRTEVYRAIRNLDNQPVIIKVLRNPHPEFNELVQFRHQYTITQSSGTSRNRSTSGPGTLWQWLCLVMPDGRNLPL
jgi:serine/threonine protein kinase